MCFTLRTLAQSAPEMTAQMTDKMDLVLDAVHYATYCGMISLDKEGHVAPPSFALFPSPIPRSERDFVASIQKDVSRLIDRSSRDRDFLHGSLRKCVGVTREESSSYIFFLR